PLSPSGSEIGVAFQIAPQPASELLNPDGTRKAEEAGQQLVKAEPVFDLEGLPEEAPPAAPLLEQPGSTWPLAPLTVALSTFWLLGACACLARSLKQLLALYRCSWQARPILDQDWLDCLASLAGRIGCSPVAMREGPAIASPLTLGLF